MAFIALRGRLTGYKIWHVMAVGALLVLCFGAISPPDALGYIDVDVMLFLFGMFVVGEAMERSGYLEHLAARLFRSARTVDRAVLLTLFGIGFASALLMNDTLAIVGTPLVIFLAARNRMDHKPLLFALAFAITIGSAVSPIGNPQNLLVAVRGGVENPFVTFGRYLLVPTLVNLIAAYLWLRFVYRKEFGLPLSPVRKTHVRDPRLAAGCKASLALMVALIAAKVALVAAGTGQDFPLTWIALAGAVPVLAASREKARLLRGVDWGTLAFFAAMFVLMGAVWESGVMQAVIAGADMNLLLVPVILLVAILLSQVMSNVPLVALYLPILIGLGAGTTELMALAAGSTIAGNLLIMGAASNVIIIQSAERHRRKAFGFLEFAKVGAPLTLVNALVYWLFICAL